MPLWVTGFTGNLKSGDCLLTQRYLIPQTTNKLTFANNLKVAFEELGIFVTTQNDLVHSPISSEITLCNNVSLDANDKAFLQKLGNFQAFTATWRQDSNSFTYIDIVQQAIRTSILKLCSKVAISVKSL